MRKIRINELARECEQPNGVIIAILPQFGVTEKKTHSSSVDEDVADRIRRHFGAQIPAREEEPEPAVTSAEEQHHEPEALMAGQERTTEPATMTAPSGSPAVEPALSAASETKPEPAAKAARPAPGLTTEEQFVTRPAAHPLRPPLAGRPAPVVPPILQPKPAAQPPVQTPPAAQVAPPPAQAAPPSPAQPVRPKAPPFPGPAVPPAAPRPAQAAPPVPGAPVQQAAPPAAQILPASPGRPSMPARPVPSTRPGQILTGPRQPLPGAPERPPRPAPPHPQQRMQQPQRPGAQQPRPQGSQQPRPPAQQSRPGGPPASMTTPGATPPSAVVTPRPALAGQPAARPVVPPRPDLVARLQQTKVMPGQPQPRPGVPLRPQSAPVPGQPIYQPRGVPGRPGSQPMQNRGGRPGGFGPPGGPGGRPRGLHPTSPLRPEVAVQPPVDQRRGQKPVRPGHGERPEREEGRLRSYGSQRRDESFKLAEGKQLTISEGITVKELSEKLGLKANLLIKKLVDRKIFATINQTLDAKMAEDLARDFGAVPERVSFEQETTTLQEAAFASDDETGPVKRPPVVTIMGHVDHGKTSLLDVIRQSDVAEHEAGGITQHIGASSIEKNGRKIVFIDTPGHEAFTRMRARGAKVTDIVVLVVAADDGVMPQTLEAIDHARAAGVPIIVAINKIDKPNAQPERVKQQLSDRGLLPEDWGGDTVMVPVSARQKQNLDLLLEMILLVADMQDLKSNPDRPGVATVLEAKLDKGRGPVATVLVRNGTVKVGDYFISGSVFGRVRGMFDDKGQPVREALPSTPVEVIGLDSLPDVGDTMQVVTDTAKAKQIVIYRESKTREQAMAKSSRLTLDQLHRQLKEGETKELPIIIKTDVGGTAEVLTETLQKLSNDKVKIRVISSGVGAITETDVLLASASNAIIIGFNVRPDRNATALADKEKVDVRLHTIIYELSDELKRAMSGMLEPVFKEVYRGRAEVRETFRITKVGTIAGCLVVDGTITRDADVRVLRDNIVVFTGKLASLKRFRDDASEVRSGLECGIGIANYNDIKPGDVFEAFANERVATEALV